MHFSSSWNCVNLMRGQAIFAFSTVSSSVTPSTKGYSACTVILSPKNCSTEGTSRSLQDLALVRPPGIEHGGFVLTPDSVWYCQVLLLFSFSAMTDTGSKSFDFALVSVMERHEGLLASGNYLNCCNYLYYFLF